MSGIQKIVDDIKALAIATADQKDEADDRFVKELTTEILRAVKGVGGEFEPELALNALINAMLLFGARNTDSAAKFESLRQIVAQHVTHPAATRDAVLERGRRR